MLEIPLFHIVVALVIHVPEPAILQDEIGWVVVDVQPGGHGRRRHISHLGQIRLDRFARLQKIHHRRPVDVVLDDLLGVRVEIAHSGNAYSGLLQPLIITQFGLDLVPEAVVIAGFMVDLLHNHLLPVAFRKIRVPALAFAQQAQDPICCSIYG